MVYDRLSKKLYFSTDYWHWIISTGHIFKISKNSRELILPLIQFRITINSHSWPIYRSLIISIILDSLHLHVQLTEHLSCTQFCVSSEFSSNAVFVCQETSSHLSSVVSGFSSLFSISWPRADWLTWGNLSLQTICISSLCFEVG